MNARARRSPLLLPVLLAPAFMVILDVFIVNVTAPSLRADLGASQSEIQLILVAYILSYAISLIACGRLGDLVGHRRMFRLGVAGFTAASAMCAAAPSSTVLIGARVLQGLAGAAMFPQMLSIIQIEYPLHERQRAFAYQNVTQALASISGQIVGGCLIALDPLGLGWRTVFMINIPVGLLVLAVSTAIVPESRSPGMRRLDLRGIALASLGLGLFLVAAIEGRELGWPVWSFVAMCAAIPIAATFVWAQRDLAARGGSPLVEPRLFSERGFRIGSAAIVVLFCNFSFFLWFSIFLQEGLRLSPLDSGLAYAPMATASALVSFAVPRLPRRSEAGLPRAGALLACCGLLIVLAVAHNDHALTLPLLLATLPLGAGLGLVMPTLMRLVLHTVPSELAGSAAGTVATAQQVGNALGVALIGTIFYSVLGRRHGVDAYDAAFAASTASQALCVFAAAVLLSRVRVRRRVTEQPATEETTGEQGVATRSLAP